MYNDQGEPILSNVDKEALEDAMYTIKSTDYWKKFASDDIESSLALACWRLQDAINGSHWH